LVVLFLPGDHFFSAALESRPDLIEEALAKKVVIATPVTLISVLKGIAYGWNQEQLAENAEEIRRVASEMYERVQLVQEHYSDTGRLLEKTVEAYNRVRRIVGFAPGARAAQDARVGRVEAAKNRKRRSRLTCWRGGRAR
jgi:DNA recombination protein RmuC